MADSSLQIDRGIKYKLYARAGIVEYWIIDMANRRTFVCREPVGGEYKSVTIVNEDEKAVSPNAPGFVLFLRELMPE